jgi:hypothetical protein
MERARLEKKRRERKEQRKREGIFIERGAFNNL